MEDLRWNLDELAERVDAALAVGYRGQPSGRVRAVPDRRAIRWYTTIGLIDRPLAYRGRTALYGPRHLLQLVAVKRLQAKGLPLVAIQQELAAATDTQLARVAHLPAGTGSAAATPAVAPGGTDPAAMAPAAGDGGAESRPGRAATGIASAADPEEDGGSRTSGAAAADDGGSRADGAAVPDSGLQADGAAVPGGGGSRIGGAEATERTAARTATGVPRVARATAARRAGFWRQQPAAAMAASTGPERTDPERTDTVVGDIATLQGIRLGEGATLLLEPGRNLDAADVRAILDAAGPLLSVLRERGFTGTVGASPPTSTTSTSPPLSTPTPPRRPARRRGGNEPREPRREQS